MTVRKLTALTIVVLIGVGIAIRLLNPEKLSALGSILSGAGSLLAVLWFSAGLRYQSVQLEEQRKQFATQFQYLCESYRRDALLLVQGILERAEDKAIATFGGSISISELPIKYMNAGGELKTLLESCDPKEVLAASGIWIKNEAAAMMLLQGIKSAAEIYLRSIEAPNIDYKMPADKFYFAYSSKFSNEPFFNSLAGTAGMLAEIMVRFSPARDAAMIAHFAAVAKGVSRDIIKMDEVRADIKKHLAAGYPLPAIAVDL